MALHDRSPPSSPLPFSPLFIPSPLMAPDGESPLPSPDDDDKRGRGKGGEGDRLGEGVGPGRVLGTKLEGGWTLGKKRLQTSVRKNEETFSLFQRYVFDARLRPCQKIFQTHIILNTG